jgi:hypothetical protein
LKLVCRISGSIQHHVLREIKKSITVNVSTKSMTTQVEVKTKVTLIEDINKGINFLFGRNITVEEFDTIYDMSILELELMIEDMQKHINLVIGI